MSFRVIIYITNLCAKREDQGQRFPEEIAPLLGRELVALRWGSLKGFLWRLPNTEKTLFHKLGVGW